MGAKIRPLLRGAEPAGNSKISSPQRPDIDLYQPVGPARVRLNTAIGSLSGECPLSTTCEHSRHEGLAAYLPHFDFRQRLKL